jgi:hypothetical protein
VTEELPVESELERWVARELALAFTTIGVGWVVDALAARVVPSPAARGAWQWQRTGVGAWRIHPSDDREYSYTLSLFAEGRTLALSHSNSTGGVWSPWHAIRTATLVPLFCLAAAEVDRLPTTASEQLLRRFLGRGARPLHAFLAELLSTRPPDRDSIT